MLTYFSQLPKLKHGLKILRRRCLTIQRSYSHEGTVNFHHVFASFSCFLTVTKRSVSKWASRCNSATQIPTMQFHSSLNPFKWKLLQQKPSSPVIPSSVISLAQIDLQIQPLTTKRPSENKTIRSLLDQLSEPDLCLLNARKPVTFTRVKSMKIR